MQEGNNNIISELSKFIREKKPKIGALFGAGISVAAGIPDFRSPGGMYDTLKPELLTATALERDQMSLDPTLYVQVTCAFANCLPFFNSIAFTLLNSVSVSCRRTYFTRTNCHTLSCADHLSSASPKRDGNQLWLIVFSKLLIRKVRTAKQIVQSFATILTTFSSSGLLEHIFTCNIDALDHQLGLTSEFITAVHGTIDRYDGFSSVKLYPLPLIVILTRRCRYDGRSKM